MRVRGDALRRVALDVRNRDVRNRARIDAAIAIRDALMKLGDAIDCRVAAVAGIVAGTLATAFQIFLWWLAGDPLPDMLFRDARLTAAMVLGRQALVPSSALDWRVMSVATIVHFALSVAYAVALAVTIRRLRRRAAIATGAAFGLLLYLVNLYGFTLLFPWFTIARGWITMLAHVAFGATAGGVYVIARKRSPPS